MKVCFEIKGMCSERKCAYTIQMAAITNVSLTSDFRVTVINYEHFPFPPFPACSISRAEVQIRAQQQ